MPIQTKRLILRQFTERDAPKTSYNGKQPTVSYFMSDMVLQTDEDALKWICWINNNKFDISIPCIILLLSLNQVNVASNHVIEKLEIKYSGEKRIDYNGKVMNFHYYQLHKPQIINIREHDEYLDRAVDYFSSK